MSIEKASRSTSTPPASSFPSRIAPHSQPAVHDKNLAAVTNIMSRTRNQQSTVEAPSPLQQGLAEESEPLLSADTQENVNEALNRESKLPRTTEYTYAQATNPLWASRRSGGSVEEEQLLLADYKVASLDDDEVENPRDWKDSVESKGTHIPITVPELTPTQVIRDSIPGRAISDNEIETTIKQLQRAIRNTRGAINLNYLSEAASWLILSTLAFFPIWLFMQEPSQLEQRLASAISPKNFMAAVIGGTILLVSSSAILLAISRYFARSAAANQAALKVYERDIQLHEGILYKRNTLGPVEPRTQMTLQNMRYSLKQLQTIQKIPKIKQLLEEAFLCTPELAGKREASALANCILDIMLDKEWNFTGTKGARITPERKHTANANVLPAEEAIIDAQGSGPSSSASHQTSENTRQTLAATDPAAPPNSLENSRSLSASNVSTFFNRRAITIPKSSEEANENNTNRGNEASHPKRD